MGVGGGEPAARGDVPRKRRPAPVTRAERDPSRGIGPRPRGIGPRPRKVWPRPALRGRLGVDGERLPPLPAVPAEWRLRPAERQVHVRPDGAPRRILLHPGFPPPRHLPPCPPAGRPLARRGGPDRPRRVVDLAVWRAGEGTPAFRPAPRPGGPRTAYRQPRRSAGTAWSAGLRPASRGSAKPELMTPRPRQRGCRTPTSSA